MPKGIIFWVLMILCLVGTGWAMGGSPPKQVSIGNGIIVWILFFLLGWAVFGFVVQ